MAEKYTWKRRTEQEWGQPVASSPPEETRSSSPLSESTRDDLRRLAWGHRSMLYAYCGHLLAVSTSTWIDAGEEVTLALRIVILSTLVVAAIAASYVAIRMHGLAMGMLLTVATLVPFVNLLVVAWLNHIVVALQEESGLPSGFFGIDPDLI